ncbi:MAG: hypothetical protein CR977_04125 [Gammaproteobacteria bacterium]|nr:MAG: hypothetical protein CR977_04125 [Gammaproteobacteria bacterium]
MTALYTPENSKVEQLKSALAIAEVRADATTLAKERAERIEDSHPTKACNCFLSLGSILLYLFDELVQPRIGSFFSLAVGVFCL